MHICWGHQHLCRDAEQSTNKDQRDIEDQAHLNGERANQGQSSHIELHLHEVAPSPFRFFSDNYRVDLTCR